jgi:hypothetical protein
VPAGGATPGEALLNQGHHGSAIERYGSAVVRIVTSRANAALERCIASRLPFRDANARNDSGAT